MRQEIKDYLIKNGGKIDYNVVLELPYLDAVINETMRFFPPITIGFARRTAADYRYKDITIPAGAHVIIPVWTLHRDPLYWPKPEKFKPERFLPENAKSIIPLTFMPFGTLMYICLSLIILFKLLFETLKY